MSKMLEEMAERIKREGLLTIGHGIIPCGICDGCSNVVGPNCPPPDSDEGALMMARWAVRQVAEALKPYVGEMNEVREKALAQARCAQVCDDKGIIDVAALTMKTALARRACIAQDAFVSAYLALVLDAAAVEKCENDA